VHCALLCTGAWGRRSFFVVPLSPLIIHDADHPLAPWVQVHVPDFHGLLIAAAVAVEDAE
jgi:hypothetical protein